MLHLNSPGAATDALSGGAILSECNLASGACVTAIPEPLVMGSRPTLQQLAPALIMIDAICQAFGSALVFCTARK